MRSALSAVYYSARTVTCCHHYLLTMSGKGAFSRGIASFKNKEYDDALKHFTEVCIAIITEFYPDVRLEAIREGFVGPQVYDSRAAVYEKQGRKKEALIESKKVIDLYPKSWQVMHPLLG